MPPRSPDRRPIPSRAPAGAFLAGLAACALSACVTAPTPAEVLAVGFRSPEQAFHSFQVAVRMNDPDLELRCFSGGFRSRNRVSQLTWREAREELYERMPWLRYGIATAEVQAREVRGAEAWLRVEAGGRELRVGLVREDFAEAWSGSERILDEEVDWQAATGVQQGGERTWVFGRAALPAGADAARLTELRLGREWKIDDVQPVERP